LVVGRVREQCKLVRMCGLVVGQVREKLSVDCGLVDSHSEH